MADTSLSIAADTTQSTVDFDADEPEWMMQNGVSSSQPGRTRNGATHPHSATTSASTSAAAVSNSKSPFPSGAHAGGADAFDAIVQAAHPSHPDHAVWQERFGGSLRGTRKSVDGAHAATLTTSMSSSANGLPLPASHSTRRIRSKSQSKATPTSRPRPSSDAAARAHLAKHRETEASSTAQVGTAPRRRNHSSQAHTRAATDEVADTASGSRTPMALTEEERAARRRRRRKEKGKAKADAPPVPPPRTTSVAATLMEPALGSPTSSMMDESTRSYTNDNTSAYLHVDDRRRAVHEGTASVPLQQASTFAAFNASAPSSPAYAMYPNDAYLQPPSTLRTSSTAGSNDGHSSHRAPIVLNGGYYARLEHEDRLGRINEQHSVAAMMPSPSTASSSSGTQPPPMRQSSKTSTDYGSLKSTTQRSMKPLAGLSLSGRRSIDFRMPDDDVAKLRAEAAAAAAQTRAPRRGLDALFSSFRSRKTTAERANSSPPKQAQTLHEDGAAMDAQMPPPILRATPRAPAIAAVNAIEQQASTMMNRGHSATPPTVPPRSPLRAKAALPAEAEMTAMAAMAVDNSPAASTFHADNSAQRDSQPREAVVGKATKVSPDPAMVMKATSTDIVNDPDIVGPIAIASSAPTVDENATLTPVEFVPETKAKVGEGLAVQAPKPTSRPNTASSRNMGSHDSELGGVDEFHDALSDEGGNGSSAEEAPKSPVGAVRRRRQRYKSTDGPTADTTRATARNATSEAAETSVKRDSSASEGELGVIPISPMRSKSQRNSFRGPAAAALANTHGSVQGSPASEARTTPITAVMPSRSDLMVHSVSGEQPLSPAGSFQTALGDSVSTDRLQRHTGMPTSYSNESSGKQLPTVPRLPSVPSGLSSRRVPPPPLTPGMIAQEAAGRGVGNLAQSIEAPSSHSALNAPSSHSLSESQRSGNGVAVPSNGVKALPNLPPTDAAGVKRQVAHQRSFSRNGNSAGGGGVISGVFSRMRRDRTPSQPNGSTKSGEAVAAPNASGNSAGQMPPLPLPPSAGSSPVIDQGESIGLGIETASTASADQQRRSSPQPAAESGGGGWRNRIPSFSSAKANKAAQLDAQRTAAASSPPLPPPVPALQPPANGDDKRRALLYSALSHSMSQQCLAPANAVDTTAPDLPSPTTIHKTLSPALLTQIKHEADDVGSYIGSDGAETEFSADSKRGTWNSMPGFELPPDQVYEDALHAGAARLAAQNGGEGGMPPLHGVRRFPTTTGNEGKRLSMTTRRLSRHASGSRLQTVPRALELASGLPSNRIVTAPATAPLFADGRFDDCEDDDGGGSSARLPLSARLAPQSPVTFPVSPSQLHGKDGVAAAPTVTLNSALVPPPCDSPRRARNQSMGSTLLSGKPRSSFADDRDRSPVVHQAWADLPPSPAPAKASGGGGGSGGGVKKFFSSTASSADVAGGKESKATLLRSKPRTASNSALRATSATSGRPSFGDLFRPSMDHLRGSESGAGTGGGKSRRAIDRLFSSPPSSYVAPPDERGSPLSTIESPKSGQGSTAMQSRPSTSSSSLHLHERTASLTSHEHSGGTAALSSPPRPSGASNSRASGAAIDVHQQRPNGSLRSGAPSTPSLSSMSFSASTSNNNNHRLGAVTPSGSSTSTAHSGAAGGGSQGAASELDAFGRMLRDRAKEDQQRVREIAQRSAAPQYQQQANAAAAAAATAAAASSSPSVSRAFSTPPPTSTTNM